VANLHVVDSTSDYLLSDFLGSWYSKDWNYQGNIVLDFSYDLIPDQSMMNISSAFHYANDNFNLGSKVSYNEKPDFLVAVVLGNYSGTWSDFYGNINNSTFTYDGERVGSGIASIAFNEVNSATNVSLHGSSLILDGTGAEFFSSKSDVLWYSRSSWLSNGNVVASSMISLSQGEKLNMNFSGLFGYTPSTYNLSFNLNEIQPDDAGLACSAYGDYVVSYYNW
jgi:hypothetical protein